MAEAVRWGKRRARINTISPGIIMTPLARDELSGPRGEGYRRMIELSVAKRAGTPDEVGTVGALLMGPDGGFITGSYFLMDGGVTATYFGSASSRRSEAGDEIAFRAIARVEEEIGRSCGSDSRQEEHDSCRLGQSLTKTRRAT